MKVILGLQDERLFLSIEGEISVFPGKVGLTTQQNFLFSLMHLSRPYFFSEKFLHEPFELRIEPSVQRNPQLMECVATWLGTIKQNTLYLKQWYERFL